MPGFESYGKLVSLDGPEDLSSRSSWSVRQASDYGPRGNSSILPEVLKKESRMDARIGRSLDGGKRETVENRPGKQIVSVGIPADITVDPEPPPRG